MPRTQAIRYPAQKGIVDTNLQWPDVQSDSTVLAAVSEVFADGVAVGGRDASRFLGAANMAVLNVVPHDGGVTVRIHIAWDDPLPYEVRFVLFD